MITLRFVTSNNVISAGIRVAEYGFWASHVECVMPSGAYLGAHAEGGVLARPSDYDAGQFTREEFVSLDLPFGRSATFYDFLRFQIGKPYDFLAIGGIVAGRDWREPDSWFCSELQAAALEASGFLPKLVTDVDHITPRDLRLILSSMGV